MLGLIGKKLGMASIFRGDGAMIPVTVLKAGPCRVVQKKVVEKDGYNAVQLGFESVKKNVNKPLKGHMERAGCGYFRILREFRVDNPDEVNVGDEIKVDIFEVGKRVKITGYSKGRGFAGVIKRHGFGGGPATHGSMFHRAPGSIGASAFPSRTIKGKKLPGHMGNERVTIKGLEIVDVKKDQDLLIVKGAVPGPNGGIVLINLDERELKSAGK